jgi:hypothetical protein
MKSTLRIIDSRLVIIPEQAERERERAKERGEREE